MTLIPRIFPLAGPVLRRVLGSSTPEIEVLQTAETEAVTPPACLTGMLERVTGTVEGNDLSYHLTAAVERLVTHAPVLRYTHRNAIVRRRGFATLRSGERFGSSFGVTELMGRITEVPTLRYCYNYVIWRYFGHWLTDAIPEAFIDPDEGQLFMPANPAWSHAPMYEKALELKQIAAELIRADRMISYQDHGQGSFKRQRYEKIHHKLRVRFGNDNPEAPVYLRRGRTGVPRWVANEDLLIDALVARNWTILDVATASVEEMQRAMLRAPVLVSIEGSHVEHATVALPKGAAMVILEPQDRFVVRFLGLCRARELRTGFTVIRGTPADGYHADLDEILRTVDLALAHP